MKDTEGAAKRKDDDVTKIFSLTRFCRMTHERTPDYFLVVYLEIKTLSQLKKLSNRMWCWARTISKAPFVLILNTKDRVDFRFKEVTQQINTNTHTIPNTTYTHTHTTHTTPQTHTLHVHKCVHELFSVLSQDFKCIFQNSLLLGYI